MERLSSKSIKTFFKYSDSIALNVIHLVTTMIGSAVVMSQTDYSMHIILTNILWLVFANAAGVYVSSKITDAKSVLIRLGGAFAAMVAIESLIWYSGHYKTLPDNIIFDNATFGLYLSLSRLIMLGMVSTVRKSKNFKKRIAIIGHTNFSEKLAKQFEMDYPSYEIAGFFEDNKRTNGNVQFPVLGSIANCIAYAAEHGITEIYSTIMPEKNHKLQSLAEDAQRNFIRFRFVPDFDRFMSRNAHVNLEEMPVFTLRSEPLSNVGGRILKRAFDIALSLFVIIFILSWLMPILAILIKLDSKGPVFFKQMRTGEKNKPFLCLKFRSLKVNKDSDTRQVTRNDDRFTKLGKFLRKSNLDELPQFFNVLMGQMSVVGSRPHMLKHTEDYSRMHANYMLRHFGKPGLTGWAQVNGYRGEIQKEEQLVQRVEHDIWYIENWNIWLDLRIVMLTFTSMVKGGDKNAF